MRLRSLVIVLSLLVVLHGYIGLRLLGGLPISTEGRILGAVLLVLSCILIPLSMMARQIRRRGLADALAWVGYVLMGLFSSTLVATILRDVVLLIAWLALPASRQAAVAHDSAILALAAAFLITLIGFVNARRRARVVDVEVPVTNLPDALHGFSIVQLSDIHVGPTIKARYVAAIVDAANALDADVIAVTGDAVDGSVQQLALHVAPLGRLKARHGAYFVTGNHEYYSGAHEWIRELRRLGLIVLMNEHVVLNQNGAQLVMAGVTDYSAHHFDPQHRSDPAKALAGAPATAGAKILLAHQPRSATAASAAGFDLQLSGHTHGGQFWPWTLFVRFQQPFTAGLNRVRDLIVYTSRGTGYWGPPKRFGAPSEITHIRLVRA